MDQPDRTLDPVWEAGFVEALRRGLATLEAQGVLYVVRCEVTAGEIITVLGLPGAPPRWGAAGPARPGTRHGRVVSTGWVRSMFTPDRPGGVADAWLHSLYPPDHPDPATLVDGVYWFRGRTPGMTAEQLEHLRPPLQPSPPPWQDDLPPGVRPDNVQLSRSYEPQLPPQI